MKDRVLRFHSIMEQYRRGDFGDEHLTLYDILLRAGEPDLIKEMTPDELVRAGLPSMTLSALYEKRIFKIKEEI